MISRRNFFAASSALFGSWALGCKPNTVGQAASFKRSALAEDLRFVFVVNGGGWDVTRVFVPHVEDLYGPIDAGCLPGTPHSVDFQCNSVNRTLGGLTYISHPDRTMVDDFFTKFHERCMILNGINVPSLAHDMCTQLMMTGATTNSHADVPAIVAGALQDEYVLPHVVISGPSFAGEFGSSVTRTGNGQLQRLLDGSILTNNSRQHVDLLGKELQKPATKTSELIDNYVEKRVREELENEQLAASSRKMLGLYQTSLQRSVELKSIAGINWSANNITERAKLTAQILAKGNIARCVTFSTGGWDTHTNSDVSQNNRFRDLFTGLNVLCNELEATDNFKNTVIVVLSEMSRTPRLNGTNGKDHWGYNSMMLIGPKNGAGENAVFPGSSNFGLFDEGFHGRNIHPQTGAPADESNTNFEESRSLDAASVCASLMQMGGVDPANQLAGVPPLPFMLL